MKTNTDIKAPQLPRLGDLPLTLEWVGGRDGVLHLLDQTRLPNVTEVRVCRTVEDVWDAIRVLCVRGAPAIGVAAAYGMCLGTRDAWGAGREDWLKKVAEVGTYLRSSRPTAVNLAWAVERITAVAREAGDGSGLECWEHMLQAAHAMAVEDAQTCRRIGEVGAGLIPDGGKVLTHCNAGSLATVAYGTALALMYVAHEQGKRFHVWADETRPLLQGARLTAYELQAAGIDVTVLCDGAAASLMRAGKVDVVITGADRIAANGDVANKIGTYGVAISARCHGVPFYVAAPRSTFDLSLADGDGIPIEQRSVEEVGVIGGRGYTPAGVACWNPAFDVTPAEYIRGIVTEAGLVEPVTQEKVAEIFPSRGCIGSTES